MTLSQVALVSSAFLGCVFPIAGQTSGASHGQSTSGRPASGHTWHMRRAAYRQNTHLDPMPQWGLPGRQGKDVDALSMLIPADWTFQAAAATLPKDCNMTSGRVFVFTTSPEKTAGLVIIPGKATMWSNDQQLLHSVQADNQQFKSVNCLIEQPETLPTKIKSLATSLAKDVQIAGPIQPLPGLSEKLASMVEQANRTLAARGAHLDAYAGRIPVRGTEQGVPTEGFFAALQVIRTDRLPNGANIISVDYPIQFATFYPQGKQAEYEPMFTAMLDSVVVDPDYAELCAQVSNNIVSINQQTRRKLQQIAGEIAADNANAARQQAAIRSGVQDYSNRVHANVAANNSAALDHSAQQFALYMGDQAIYKDPSTGARVQMSSQYSHAYANTTGNTTEYILTDSPSYNPGANWTQLQQQH